ncbi:HAMP domain-containing sensor histidine kinase [Clostridium intestinale]|jgi:two-component system phosphate regulon sensor histidine kinase PhoR|uniref:histidine kinase n=2 Tax=Clostridium intestinale TaxID=36845 RepID=U2PUV0_9CLOT|nr:ATP-binding protein [Clostridium intestinale]ERK30220.1 Sensory histidine kinase with HAMP and PAS domains [Clostridium intestinale URNW]QLY81887.1 HAMP domain-containing protein [Clostridium intestinale]
MKKKILITVIIAILFALIVISSSFIAIVNYRYIDSSKETLKFYNDLIKYSDLSKIENLKELVKADEEANQVRITYILPDGTVIYDTNVDKSTLENHNNREEVKEAEEKGEGSAVRYSTTLKKTLVYYATKLNDGSIIRTSIAIENTKVFKDGLLKYYLIILAIVISISIIISLKLIRVILEPVREMEFITSRIARGELNRRVKILSNDELGTLGKTFNNMADQLQGKINEVLDKQNRLEAILQSMDSGVIAVDRKHNVIMMNHYSKKIFGIKKDIIGEPLMDHIRDFELDLLFEKKDIRVHEIKIIWPRESILRIRTADIINGLDYIGTVAVLQDITDIRRLENIRSQFVANVSHELKTPLTSIKGFAETLKYVKDDDNRERFLNIINDEAERLTRLINDILTLSNIEQKGDVFKEEFFPNDVIDDVFILMNNLIEDKKIKLEFENNNTKYLYGSRDGFKQMLINLIENAIKYSEEGDKVIFRSYNSENKLVIEVEDTGCGIPESEIPRIFERFYRVDKARSRAKGGTGLGLAIVKHIVKNFNGDITVKSVLGKGSNFVVKIKYI